jgi:RNA polymerase sigma-54 factor
MDLVQQESQDMRQTVSPRMVQASSILAMSSQALQQAISAEAQDNPALEVDEVSVCPRCGDKLEGAVCITCGEGTAERDPTEQFLQDEATRDVPQNDDEEFDPLTVVATELSLGERLIQDLGSMLDSADMPMAEYLVGALDETGYLRASVDEIAWHFEATYEDVERVLELLQSFDPPGVGARDIRECVLIQIRRLEESDHHVHPLAATLIQDYLEEIGKHRFAAVARQLKQPVEDVEAAWDFIKTQLSPYPAYMFEEHLTVGRSSRTEAGQAVIPDIIVTIDAAGELRAEVIESKRYQLRVSRPYEQVLRQVREGGSLTEEEREHVRAYVQRARQFINSIQQRRRTMQLLSDFLLDRQHDFLKDGVRHLKPLTRAKTAAAVGVHESTVSRAAAEKFVLLPSGKVVPLSDFFKAALPVQDVMREIIEDESGGAHRTDRQISDRLQERGYKVARRTVAKYRAQMKILPSELRS